MPLQVWLSLQTDKESIVHIQTFIAAEKEWFNSDIFEKINKVKEVRRSVTTAIEIASVPKTTMLAIIPFQCLR